MKVINKDGHINRVHARSLWNYVVDASIDSFNQDADRKELDRRFNKFISMLEIISNANKHQKEMT